MTLQGGLSNFLLALAFHGSPTLREGARACVYPKASLKEGWKLCNPMRSLYSLGDTKGPTTRMRT